jgi:hypothetical protein
MLSYKQFKIYQWVNPQIDYKIIFCEKFFIFVFIFFMKTKYNLYYTKIKLE